MADKANAVFMRQRYPKARKVRYALVIWLLEIRTLVRISPSPHLIFDWRLAIFDWSQKKMRDQQRAKNPQDRSAHNVGQIMRSDVHARKRNENRNGKAGKADAPACKK